MAEFQTRNDRVEAVQWRGDNLSEIQRLLLPGSPLLDGDPSKPADKKHIGVNVTKSPRGPYEAATELKFADVGDWVVRWPSGRLAIVGEKDFVELFQIPDAPVVEREPAPFQPGQPIEATHPRALADRQPEEGERPSVASADDIPL